MARCAQCGKQVGGLGGVKGGLVTTATGRRVCRPCNERLLGTAAGIITAGPDASTSEQLGSGILVTGWLERVRAARRRGRD
jgi:DNA-directed RNA polymerase subunit RPC12/RpoP